MVNWSEVTWQYDDLSFENTAKAVLLFNPEPWDGYTVETLVEQMKELYQRQCRREEKIVPWVGTGGFYVCGMGLNYTDTIFVIATLSASIVVDAFKKATGTKKDWKERERERFESGHYKQVPWANDINWQAWATNAIECEGHFVHISTTDPYYLSYTKNEENGEKDKKTRISPEAYLNKYVTGEYREYIDDWLEYYE